MQHMTQQTQAQESAKEMADRLMNKGLKGYCIAGRWYGLWIPWGQEVVDASDTQTIKRIFGIATATFANDFSIYCLLEREPLQVPSTLARKFPMPLAASGDNHPSIKDMMKWAQSILRQIHKKG